MFSRFWSLFRSQPGLLLKSGSVCFLFLISVLIVACGANNSAQVPGSPPVTVTINLDQTFGSPTPALPPYSCGAWATQSTPAYAPNAIVDVYAKFVQNVNGNPVGMGGAHGIAYVSWPTVPLRRFQRRRPLMAWRSFRFPSSQAPCEGLCWLP